MKMFCSFRRIRAGELNEIFRFTHTIRFASLADFFSPTSPLSCFRPRLSHLQALIKYSIEAETEIKYNCAMSEIMFHGKVLTRIVSKVMSFSGAAAFNFI